MVRNLFVSLCVIIAIGSAFSDVEHTHDHHDHSHDHDHGDDQDAKYPVIIHKPGSERTAKIDEIHSAENTEIGSPPDTEQLHPESAEKNKVRYDKGYPTDQNGGPSKYKSQLRTHIQQFGYPNGCIQDHAKVKGPSSTIEIEETSCKYSVVITLKPTHDKYGGIAHFKMSRKMDKPYGYISVGLSTDNKMDDDHIVECVKVIQTEHPTMYHSWSNFHSTPTRQKDDSALISYKAMNYDEKTKTLTCEFDRPLISEVKYIKGGDQTERKQVFNMLAEKYKIFVAVGETQKPDSTVLGYHGPRTLDHVAIFDQEHPHVDYSSGFSQTYSIVTILFMTLCSIYIL